MASPLNERRLHDEQLTVTATLPNAANTVNSNGIDLQTAVPYPVTEGVVVRIDLFGAATGVNTKNINIRLMDSTDNTTFTNVAVVANPILRVTAANEVFASGNVRIALPIGIQRYIRATALGESGGGDSSDGTFGIKLEF
jgi:hypothetical protein